MLLEVLEIRQIGCASEHNQFLISFNFLGEVFPLLPGICSCASLVCASSETGNSVRPYVHAACELTRSHTQNLCNKTEIDVYMLLKYVDPFSLHLTCPFCSYVA